jgi:hypothetical protein
MTLRFVLLLLFGVLLRAAGSVKVLIAERSSARDVDGGLLSIINEIPTCAVSIVRPLGACSLTLV